MTCKQTWTNRRGTEYVWFNNVETHPGLGYPRRWSDQEKWRGGWRLTRRGRLALRQGGRARRLLEIFANPVLPTVPDYYEPWTYDYAALTRAPLGSDFPVARPRSLLTGRPMDTVAWSANWDDDLGGAAQYGPADPVVQRMREEVGEKVRFAFEESFMFYLPRICEHCLNPSCVASCPSGAMYKRTEDGIVLVDQDRCRGWRQCVTGCPYKKVYFNHRTGKAEKCTFCFPRIEVGLPTVCSETCVGRLRYLGVMLYDADRVTAAAAARSEQELYEAQLGVFLDPADPQVVREAEAAGIPHDWIEAARRSPVHALISRHKVALPLHPEYRTLPMVWYIPPLSPVVDAVAESGRDGEDAGNLFGAIDALRIPVEYLAGLFTAGDVVPVRSALGKLAAMRSYMRARNVGEEPDEGAARAAGLDGLAIEELYHLLAIAKYPDRYVIPTAAMADAHRLEESVLPDGCAVDFDGAPEMSEAGDEGPFGGGSGRRSLPLITLENSHAAHRRQHADREEQL